MANLLTSHPGEMAALGAATCWTFTSLSFAAAGRRIGPTAVNLIRIILATIVLAGVHRASFGVWVPEHDATGLILLAISGVIGLTIGDQLLFTAFVDIGPRLSTLLMTLAPPLTAVLAWPVLDERLGLVAIVGMTITIGGVAWVVRERPAGASTHAHGPHRLRGVLFGIGGGLCQAVGLVIAKVGIGHTRLPEEQHLDAWPTTLVRMAAAMVGILVMAAILRWWRKGRADATMDISVESEHLPPPRRRGTLVAALVFTAIGTVFGPVLGVWLSIVSVDQAKTGIAATLMATTPVLILPFARWLEKEHVSWRAVLGAVVALVGVCVLTAL